MTAPLNVGLVRAEWSAAIDTFPDESLTQNMAVFADRWGEALLDHCETLEKALRQIGFTETHDPAAFARTILEEVVAT